MSISPLLENSLRAASSRERHQRLWCSLAVSWAGAALFGLALLALERLSAFTSSLAPLVTALVAVGAVIRAVSRQDAEQPDARELARRIESFHPELEGRLLTAVQQPFENGGNFFEQRLLIEVLQHRARNDWTRAIPRKGLVMAQAAHWLGLALFLVVLSDMRVTSGRNLMAHGFSSASVNITPGDVALERGNSLVVLARFTGALPPNVDLVLDPAPAQTQRIPLVKSLADPMFGGSVPEVVSNLAYHLEYSGQRTRDFKVTVFEYPRLERADAVITFPPYTSRPPKKVENTRRLSAVEGSRLDLRLNFNKPVTAASLVGKDQRGIPLLLESNRAGASLSQFLLQASTTCELRLVDAEGRTNKVESPFTFEVLTNRVPEMRLASPRGDLRPSPLEEISFEGTVWDDFGVKAFGLAYALVGQAPIFVEFGRDVPGNEKRPFHHVLRLEDLAVEPDQLISWFVWADDVGPDGQVRRTTGDLFFAELRPFEEAFREGQGGDNQGESQSGAAGGQTGRLAELQKQIISATWKLQRDHGPAKSNLLSAPRQQSLNAAPERLFRGAAGSGADHPLRRTAGRFIGLARVAGQLDSDADAPRGAVESPPDAAPTRARPASASTNAISYESDAAVVRDSQAQALEQAQSAMAEQRDPRAASLWSSAAGHMESALEQLSRASNSPSALREALAAEQAAYQALLKLQEHEYQVARSRNRNQRGGSRNQQMQRQLDQLDLTQTENRYETLRQAQPPQSPQRREQSQVMSRLQDLARRQQDLNDRLKELQTALQEARTEPERQEIQRRLKRLQEEEQQMLADVDELRQRMERPENQSTMTDSRRQLDQTRDDVQRAEQAAGQGAASQALAAGSRAQRQLQQLRDQLRKETSSQYADDLKEMRSQARELAQRQDDISKQIEDEAASSRQTLSDSPEHQSTLDQLARQTGQLTNLIARATRISEQAEEAEPLLSRQLYDTVRQFTQDSSKNLQESQDQLLERGLMTRDLYDRLKNPAEADSAKLFDITSEMLRRGALPPAQETSRRARAQLGALKNGVERAAESVIGDDTEALRLAQQELERLTDQLHQEMSLAGSTNTATNGASSRAPRDEARNSGAESAAEKPGPAPTPASTSSAGATETGGARPGSEEASAADSGASPGEIAQQRPARPGTAADAAGGANGGDGGDLSGSLGRAFDRLFDPSGAASPRPLTGDDFLTWSDRLRDVEEMLDSPNLRTTVAAARDRARLMRQEFKRDRKKPDWAVVQLQLFNPLVQVRDQIAEELARRDSREALVPVDRDPVPDRYSELVRRYYEQLGKER